MNEWFVAHELLADIIMLCIATPPFIYALWKIYNNDIADGWEYHI